MENNIEKKVKNEHESLAYVFGGALVETIFYGIGISALLIVGIANTYAFKNINNNLQGFQTPSDEMLLYAIRNSTKALMGATTVSAIRYLF